MIALLALHAVAGLACIAGGARLGRRAIVVGVVPVVITLAWLVVQLPAVVDGDVIRDERPWVPALDLALTTRLDGFALLMALLVAGIGVTVFAFAGRYLPEEDPAVARLAGLLTLFAGAMLGVVVADDVLLLYTCWELTSITSYLLIGHRNRDPKARAAALHALVVTGAGALAMLGGLVILAQEAGSHRLSDILAAAPSGTAASVAVVLVLLGVATKSALYPFHGWLPAAMAAPTPISAYLHSATMVKAGIYLLARLAPVFAVLGFWRPLVAVVALVTIIGGGLRALRQHDLKLLLAFSTVSQLGYLALLLGLGRPAAIEAGCVLLVAHGLGKAALFMVVGMLDHETGSRDLRTLPALGPGWGLVRVVTVVSAASMAGLPLMAGFIAKESAFDALLDGDVPGGAFLAVGLVVGAALSVAYSARFVWGVFVEPRRRGAAVLTQGPALGMVAPAAVLAATTVLLGLWPAIEDGLLSVAARSLVPGAPAVDLALWHGFTAPLALSAIAIALGAVLFWARPRIGGLLARGEAIPSGADVYLALLRGLNTGATKVTGIVQNGSLPVYAGVIVLTATVLPTTILIRQSTWPGWPRLVDAPAHVAVALVVAGAALGAAVIGRRLSAVLFLGVVGYGMAALFVVQGAPDLALTQVAIETLSTVLFVLVLRRLPTQFERRPSQQRRIIRLAIAATVAASVFVFALLSSASRTAEPISDAMVEDALPEGNGRNVVNVILVDFRGLDTLGEITVLAAAAIGAVALARAGRRPRPAPLEEVGSP